MKVMVMPVVVGALGTIFEWLVKGLEDLEIKLKETPVRKHQLTLVWKTVKGINNDNNWERRWEKKKDYGSDGIGLVSLFNGISTFAGYLMPKPFS